MSIRITSGGFAAGPRGTRVFDLETGVELDGITRIDIEPITADAGLVRARLTFTRVALELGESPAGVEGERWGRLRDAGE